MQIVPAIIRRARQTRGSKPALALAAGALLAMVAGGARAAQPEMIRQFISYECADCHDAQMKKGDLDLTSLAWRLDEEANFKRWVKVHDKLDHGEMPPPDKLQPIPEEKAAFLKKLRSELIDAEQSHAPTQVRRMNRVEYETTLRDLLDLPLLRIKESLPEDGKEHGFKKVAGALDVSFVQMRKYMEVADKALDEALVELPEKPQTETWRQPAAMQWTARKAIGGQHGAPVTDGRIAPGLSTHIRGNPRDDPGNTYRAASFKGEADSLVVLSGVLGAHQPEGIQIDRFKPKVPGWYRVRFSVWGLRWNGANWDGKQVEPAIPGVIRKYDVLGGEPFKDENGKWQFKPLPRDQWKMRELPENVEFLGKDPVTHVVRASLKGEVIGFYDVPSLEPAVHEFKIWLNPGDKISFHAMTLPATGPRNHARTLGARAYEGPGIAYDWFEVEGPLVEQWPPVSQQRLFGELPVEAYPRPLNQDAPTVQPDQTVTIDPTTFTGSGLNASSSRVLNLDGTTRTTINCAQAGEYELAVKVFQTPAGDEDAKLRLMVDGQQKAHRTIRPTPSDPPDTIRVKFDVPTAKPVEISLEFLNDYYDGDNPDKNRRDRNIYITEARVSGLSAGDNDAPQPPDARQLLRQFAERAFRRPVASAEMDPYVDLVESELSDGRNFKQAMLYGYKAILCAPDFLFIGFEGAGDNTPHADNFALASRLSYLLFNSMPDDRLLRLAAEGKLADAKTLGSEVERMLEDPRSERFVEHFLDQWLELEEIDFTTPDPKLYPEFDPWLQDSMLAETRGYFRKMLDENLSIDHLIDSDFILVNQRLARQYDMKGITGSNLRPVKVPEGSMRGGVMTQASILKVTANGTATSPVLRGVWVSERLLGVHPDPPPDNIPSIEPDASGATTVRELIEMHSAEKSCASCHVKFDPPGMALESFDVIGGLRDRYRVSGRPKRVKLEDGRKALQPHIEVLGSKGRERRIRVGQEVDASGELVDGRTFENVEQLKDLLLEDRRRLARNLVRNLLIYATGSSIRFSDRPEIEAILDRAGKDNYGLRTLLHEVVQSEIFQRVQLPPELARSD